MSFALKLTLVMVLVLGSGPLAAQNPTLKTAMRAKLASTQGLLEAVVTSDFAAMDRSAAVLGRISETDISSWQVGVQPEYKKQATAFVRSVQRLREAAVRRNIETALAEYTALVSSCTRCHVHVRRALVVSFEPPPFR
jgi:hypothetical protein